jgi:hypothetical protein
MVTTVSGIGVLVLAILSVLGQFGVLTALSILYSFLASLLVLPSVLVLWDRYRGNDPSVPIGAPADDDGDGAGADAVSGSGTAPGSDPGPARADGGEAPDGEVTTR